MQIYEDEWQPVAEVLKERAGFSIVNMGRPAWSDFSTKAGLILREISNVPALLANLGKYRNARMIVCANYCALFLALFAKLRLIRCKKLIWFGIYIHNPVMFRAVRICLRLLASKRMELKIVVFSRPEIKLYAEHFSMPESRLIYLPYGEWKKDKQPGETGDKGYFFSGGYANRDYVTLVKMFAGRPEKLVIAASRKNEDFVRFLQSFALPDNIEVHWDIPTARFQRLLGFSRAVILIMKYNTGASGQIVALTALEYGKLVLTSESDVLAEYVSDGQTGIVLKEKTGEEMARVLDEIAAEENRERFQKIAEAGHAHYKACFSYEAISGALVNAMRGEAGT